MRNAPILLSLPPLSFPLYRSGDDEMTLKCTEKDFESDEAVWDMYYRWCLFHKILRTHEEMQQRFRTFRMNVIYGVRMSKLNSSLDPCLSIWWDKIDRECLYAADERILTTTKGDMESDEAFWDLYYRWCLNHRIHRTPEEMKLAFYTFRKSATYAFDMNQKDPAGQFCLSIWCDVISWALRSFLHSWPL